MKLALAAVALFLIAAAAAVAPLQPYQDFQVLYHANMGLLRGIALYDQRGQVEMIAGIAGVAPSQVYVLPFPYPPWYALSSIWLARLPVEAAARVWFGLNLIMLVASIAWMTAGELPLKRALLFTGAFFWVPVLGGLLVGQYGYPVLVGAVLMAIALRNEKPLLSSLAAVLLSFKPHIGAPILLLVMMHLVIRRDVFARSALLGLAVAAAALFGVGFLASPQWPFEYIRSLASFQGVHGVPQCTQCVSVPAMLSRSVGGGLGAAAWIALALATLACGWLAARWKAVAADPMRLVSIGVLITLLVSPYLLNYDYLLLLVPLTLLAREARSTLEWILLGLAYLLPAAAFAIWGTAGSPGLIASTCIVSALALRRLGSAPPETVRSSA